MRLFRTTCARVLSYSLINQLGFMVCGIGIGTALAMNGAVSHAFVHIIYKSLLFMSMGAVLHMTGKIRATEIGGLYKTMPKTAVLCIIGAASISAFPLFSGFVAKSMIMAGSAERGLHRYLACSAAGIGRCSQARRYSDSLFCLFCTRFRDPDY